MSSYSIATGVGTGASTGAANGSSASTNKKQKISPPFDSLLLDKNEIWLQGILPLVGVGQYAFIGAVNKKMNQLYKEYCKTELEKNPGKVKINPEQDPNHYNSHPAESTDTLYSETFSNEQRAEFWLKDNSNHKSPARAHVCTAIAKIGNLTVMKWARQKGFPWNEKTCAGAAKNGHLKMLQWLRENGCPWNVWTCSSAARFGHLKILKWARENGCPWDANTCSCAAEKGQLEVLKWARAKDCPWSEWTFHTARIHNEIEAIQWLRDNGCPGSRN
ncbi:expressed unknown protein [Seminavis robusta]|uniref:Uncharacterized protein n=1 Tax=Seminavis robusta TaxID=568900 RepID=A0A9N8EWN8_9STRA|nr:expressed unknown protein [Seminavis robusta]|eukprot:Sro1915_g305100.2  (275) ;mRNA; r:4960-5784